MVAVTSNFYYDDVRLLNRDLCVIKNDSSSDEIAKQGFSPDAAVCLFHAECRIPTITFFGIQFSETVPQNSYLVEDCHLSVRLQMNHWD